MTTNDRRIIHRMAISELEGEALTKDELFSRLAEKAHFLKGYKAPKKKTELWAEVFATPSIPPSAVPPVT